MEDYDYLRIRRDILIGIYEVNDLYVKRVKESAFNPELYNVEVGQELIDMCISRNFTDNISILLERMPNPNTRDVLGKSLLEHFVENKKFEEAIKLLKMGATPSQNVMRACLMRGQYISGERYPKFYNDMFMKLLIQQGLTPFTREELLQILEKFYRMCKNFKLDRNSILSNIDIPKCLLAFEKRVKTMYRYYIGIQ